MTRFDDAEAAETAFYQAFNSSDGDAMDEIWDDADDLCCIHPSSDRVEGRAAVLRSWRDIFASSEGLSVSVEPLGGWSDGALAVRICYEHLRDAAGRVFRPAMITTNMFRKAEDGWRMILHHASPAGRPEFARRGGAAVH